MSTLFGDELKTGAIFSPCRTYRYRLWRQWDSSLPWALFCGLNPSTADEAVDDPTIRREIGFAKLWGFGGLYKVNAFGYRSTDPRGLASAADPIGPDNDWSIAEAAAMCEVRIAAWGADKAVTPARVKALLAALGPCYCLGTTKAGHPKHPLYLPANAERVKFEVRA